MVFTQTKQNARNNVHLEANSHSSNETFHFLIWNSKIASAFKIKRHCSLSESQINPSQTISLTRNFILSLTLRLCGNEIYQIKMEFS
jgi:hypothetical protein